MGLNLWKPKVNCR